MDLRKLVNKHSKLIKFLIVWVSSTLVEVWFLFVFVDFFEIPLFFWIILSFLLAVLNWFIWNKFWTFRDKSVKYKRQFTKFLFVSTGGLLLTLCFMYFFTSILSIHYIISKLLTSAIVVVWNFLLNKYWTFKIKTHKFEENIQ